MPRILIVPVGEPAKILDNVDPWIHAQKELSGGKNYNVTLQEVRLEDGVVIYCDEDADIKKLPFNRAIPARMPALPPGVPIIDTTDGKHPAPGEMGVHRIHGYFILTRFDPDMKDETQPYIDLTNNDVWKYCNLLNERWRVR